MRPFVKREERRGDIGTFRIRRGDSIWRAVIDNWQSSPCVPVSLFNHTKLVTAKSISREKPINSEKTNRKEEKRETETFY